MNDKRELWVADIKEIKDNRAEFDEARRCLLNSYHSYVQTHAGYIIATTIGFLTLVASFRSFLDNGNLWTVLSFVVLVGGTLGVSIYMIFRIEYWTYHANCAIVMSLENVISIFNQKNLELKLYYEPEEAPYLNILQVAIEHGLKSVKRIPWYMTIALRTEHLFQRSRKT